VVDLKRLARWSAHAAWFAVALAVVTQLAWTRRFEPAWLFATSALILGSVAAQAYGRRAGRAERAAALLWAVAPLVVSLAVAVLSQRRFEAIEFDWATLVDERRAQLAETLEQRMRTVVARGGEAAEAAAEAAADASRGALFGRLEALRTQTGVDALAVFTDAGDLFAWAGDHRGRIPDAVRREPSGAHFAERPLYSYLYVVSPVEGRAQHAVAAVLVETGLVTDEDEQGVTDTFAATTDVRAIFHSGPGSGEGVVWSLAAAGDTVVHARFEAITQSEVRAEVERSARSIVGLLALFALLILSVGWVRRVPADAPRSRSAWPLLAWAVALPLAPLSAMFGLGRLFGPSMFVLDVPGDPTLGALLALLVPLGALVATFRPRPLDQRGLGVTLLIGVFVVVLAYPYAIRLLLDAAGPPLLQGGPRLWLGLQFTATLLLAVLTLLVMPRRAGSSEPGAARPTARRATLLVLLGLAVAAVLALLVHGSFRLRDEPWTWPTALWVVPFLLVGTGLATVRGKGGRLLRWLAAGWLSATAVLPHIWAAHQQARLETAAIQLASLGAQPSPILDYLLAEFGRETARRYAAGEQGVQLLYRSWVGSGLAEEPYAARITLWSPALEPEYELNLGGAEISDAAASTLRAIVTRAADESQDTAVVHTLTGLQNVAKLVTARLDSGRMISAAVPPRRTLERASMVAPFLGAAPDPDIRLELVSPQEAETPSDEIRWFPSVRGWRSEAVVRYPEGEYHAHMEVRVPSLAMQLARGVLLIAFDLAALLALWAIGNAARGTPAVPRGGWSFWLGSFRARVTLALFFFFVAPAVMFGWVAYRALAREVDRTAQTVADRAVRQAVLEFADSEGDLRELATHAGTDVLYYYNSGELAEVSSPEALELGVYGAWMSPEVYLQLASGEENTAQEPQRVGRQSFLLAYRTLRPAGTLAVPASLTAGEAAVRQRELAHLVLFAVVIGALLSLALSVLVGRQLAGPIGKLRRAATAVGAGHLRVRLPEPAGEFGQLFASFNRMVRRLRRARTREIRTARVLAWGEMARQIAHEIKNPLTPIKLSVQHLRRAHADGRKDFAGILDENVDQILKEIDRLSEIARAFSRYGAPGELEGPLAAVDLRSVVREALTLYRAGDSAVEYRDEIAGDLPAVQARSGELKEVLLNLIENARAALDGEGRIVVTAERVEDRVELDIIDDGPGIPPELLSRVFEPHFSTRSTGTGLGLAIVRRIVEDWGGSVTAESEPGRGTRVRVRMLPAPEGQRTR
jgi:signal transduction histidine kinase